MSPQTWMHAVGRLFIRQKTICIQIPHWAAVGAQHALGWQGSHQTPARIVKRTVIVQGQMQTLGGLA
jgi:hypothetical protein